MRNNRGLTLMEVIIVIVIVGILASVAVPFIQNLKWKAIAAEAINTLGAIRVAEQLYYNKYHVYNKVEELELRGYLKQDSLNGIYFSHRSYEAVFSWGPPPPAPPQFAYIICCINLSQTEDAPKASEIKAAGSWGGQEFSVLTQATYIAVDVISGTYYSNIDLLGYSHLPIPQFTVVE